MRLQSVTPPTVEPITLQDAKLHLRVDYPDDDSLIQSLITASRVYCENALWKSLLAQSWILYLDSFPSAGGYYNRAIRETWPSLGGIPSGLGFYPGMIPNSTGVINIPRPPVTAVTSVQYYDFANVLQTFPPASYVISLGTPSRIQPAYSHIWPIARPTIDAVQIQFNAGYSTDPASIPEPVKAAMKLCIGTWYWNREWVTSEGSAAIVPGTVDALLGSVDHGRYA